MMFKPIEPLNLTIASLIIVIGIAPGCSSSADVPQLSAAELVDAQKKREATLTGDQGDNPRGDRNRARR